MNDVDLTTPLLQLNPPVLVRADGGNPSAIDLVAVRRAAGMGGGGATSPAHTTTTNMNSNSSGSTSRVTPSTSPSSSVAARKLHDAKSTARQVAALNGGTPSRAHTTEMPGRRKGVLGAAKTNHTAVTPLSGLASTRAAADGCSYGAAGSAPPSPSAAAARGTTTTQRGAAPPTGAFLSSEGKGQAVVMLAAAAAPVTSSEDQSLALNLPYLMRHIQDTGALLDTLFPLQSQHGAAGGTRAEDATAVSVQTVSAAPASREDVMALHATLRARLAARRARADGLCAIRRAIYVDLFSELVRQVTVEEPARGLLLARLRENEEHALHVHAGLLREGENFVAGKLLQDTRSAAVLLDRLSDLRADTTQLEIRRHDMQDARKELERRFEEMRQTRRAQQQDELNYLRRANQQLSLRLKLETERASAGGVAGGTSGGGGEGEEAPAASATATPAIAT